MLASWIVFSMIEKESNSLSLKTAHTAPAVLFTSCAKDLISLNFTFFIYKWG